MGEGEADGGLTFRGNEEEEETAASGAEEFAAEGAGVEGGLIVAGDGGRGDVGMEAHFEGPGLVEEFAEGAEGLVSGEDGVAEVDLGAHFLEAGFVFGAAIHLAGGEIRGAAADAGVEEQEVILKGLPAGGREADRVGEDVAVGVKFDDVEAAESGEGLVLAADTFAEDVLFDVDGGAGEVEIGDGASEVGVESVQEADDEGG